MALLKGIDAADENRETGSTCQSYFRQFMMRRHVYTPASLKEYLATLLKRT
jgi:hypothetical protein